MNYKNLLILGISFSLFISCKKNNGDGSTNPKQTTQSGNTTTYGSGYVVKTIGISRINVILNDFNEFAKAELFGGGNKIILQPGIGNDEEWIGSLFHSAGTGIGGTTNLTTGTIDNGKMLDTSGLSQPVYKIKGFDKGVYGYNQLNIVFFNYVRPSYISGIVNTLYYLTYNANMSTKNDDYNYAFADKLFNGYYVSVTDVELAKPISEQPYITQDEVFDLATASVDPNNGNAKFYSSTYQVTFNAVQNPGNTSLKPSGIKTQWVNANGGTITKINDLAYKFTLNNIKQGKIHQIVEPTDTLQYAFLRITGLDPAIFGANQVRYFPINMTDAGSSSYNGSFQVAYTTKPATEPTLADLENQFLSTNKFLTYLGPVAQ